MKQYDLLTMGRSSIDLYANDIGADFEDIKAFSAYVGGSPTNIATGSQRLGLTTALLTAVGEDPVGDFVKAFIRQEGIDAQFIPTKPGHRTSAVALGIQPPDKFPLVYYRDNCADIELTIDDVDASPIDRCTVFEFAGTNLSKDPSRTSTFYAAERAEESGATVVLDIDFRPDQWYDPRAFGVAIRSILPLVDVIIGTTDEINAALLKSAGQMTLTHSQVSDTAVAGDTDEAIAELMSYGAQVLIHKTGPEGATIHQPEQPPEPVPGFPVEVENILGAGDAFASGFIYGLVNEWGHYKSVRLANACGALVVQRHACANSMPTMTEVDEFVAGRGGL